MNALEISHLSFSYGNSFVLEDISFSVSHGEFVAIFGPNGGGKTTLLQLLMGFLKPTSGKILVYGVPPKEARLKMGWVPQTFHYDRNFPISVREVVLGGRLGHLPWHGRPSKHDLDLVYASLEKVGMRASFSSPFADLSGGQAQRVLIARALASEPTLLFLDEPTASVDPEAQETIYRLLNQLKTHMTILMVTHHIHQAVRQADRLLCVQGSLTPFSPQKVCEHFSLGLYHLPQSSEPL